MPSIGCPAVNVLPVARGSQGASPPLVDIGTARNWSTVEWHRLENGISGAQIRVEGRAQCCDWASKIKPWRDEIAVFYDTVRVWSGPVTEVHWVGDELRIDCKDRYEWMRRRKIHNDHDYGAAVDLSTIFGDIVTDALSVDTSPNYTLAGSLCGTTVGSAEGRKFLGSQSTYAIDALNELSRTGVDWTMIDRTLTYGGPKPTANTLPLLRPVHFEDEPEAVLDGDLFGTRFTVVGNGVGEAADKVSATNTPDATLEATYGVHERIEPEPLIRDNASALSNANARYRLYGQFGIPFYLSGGKLRPSAPIDVSDLIPGSVFRVQVEDPCKPVPRFVRLSSVTGSVGPEHQYISVNFEPIGTENTDV